MKKFKSTIYNKWIFFELTCRHVGRLSGSGSQDELALLAHLWPLPLQGRPPVSRRRAGVPPLEGRVSHVVHLDAEGELVT